MFDGKDLKVTKLASRITYCSKTWIAHSVKIYMLYGKDLMDARFQKLRISIKLIMCSQERVHSFAERT